MGCCGSSDYYELKIEILGAANLPDVDLIGKIDPFVKTRYKDEEYETEKKKGEDNPRWNGEDDNAVYKVEDGERGQADIVFELMDWDRFTKNDSVGTARITREMQNIPYNEAREFDLQLKKKGEDRGVLKVRITFVHEGDNPREFQVYNAIENSNQTYGNSNTTTTQVNQTTIIKKTVIVEEEVVVKKKKRKMVKNEDGVDVYEDEQENAEDGGDGGDAEAGDAGGDGADAYGGDEEAAAEDGGDGGDAVDAYAGAEPQDDKDKPPESGTKVLSDDNVYEFPILEYNTEDRWLISKKSRKMNMITIVTQCSIDRLPQLRAMCMGWTGIISVAVYIKENVEMCKSMLKDLFKEMERCHNVILDISLLYENNLDRKDKSGVDILYPINHLRNLALENAKTDLVFLLDVDFVPSQNMHEMLVTHEIYTQALTVAKKTSLALVIPAFEIRSNDTSIDAHPRTKADVLNLYNSKNASAFHVKRFAYGHRATNYSFWFQSNEVYGIEYELMYEPYIIIKKDGLRKYDERYRGYGMNKIIHLAGLALKDSVKFAVLPNMFVSAAEHNKSTAYYKVYGRGKTRVEKNAKLRRKNWLKKLWKISLCELIEDGDNDMITKIKGINVEENISKNVVSSWTNKAQMV